MFEGYRQLLRRLYPELYLFAHPKDDLAVFWQACRPPRRTLAYRMRSMAALLVAMPVIWFGLRFTAIIKPTSWPMVDHAIRLVILAGPFMGVSSVAMHIFHRADRRSRLRAMLLERAIPVCQTCGYDLRGLPLDVRICTECETPIPDLTQALRDPANASNVPEQLAASR